MIPSSNARQLGTGASAKLPEREITLKRKWQFRPRSIRPLLAWGFVLFVGAKLLVIPLAEGVYGYVVKTQEVRDLRNQYKVMKRKIADMSKLRDYMKTPAYIEERGHQIGLIKSNESKMVVMDAAGGAEIKKKSKKQVEIGD